MGPCPNCDAELVGVSCKLRCPRCGYFESCSDLEPHPPVRTRTPGAGPDRPPQRPRSRAAAPSQR